MDILVRQPNNVQLFAFCSLSLECLSDCQLMAVVQVIIHSNDRVPGELVLL